MSGGSVSATAMRVIMRQVQEMMSKPIDGIQLRESDDLSSVEADIIGPEDTPFFGAVFRVELVMSSDFPEQPPKGYFRTRIFHPNVSEKGEICVNTLKKDWDPSLGLRHVLTVIRCLLIEPNPESALNEEAGMLLLENYSEYVKKARMMASIHARKAPVPAAAVASSSSEPPRDREVTPPPHQSSGIVASPGLPVSGCSASAVSVAARETDSTSVNGGTPTAAMGSAAGLQLRTPTDSNSTSSSSTGTSAAVAEKKAVPTSLDKRKAALKRL